MTERENFFPIIRRTEYKRIPVMYSFCPYLQETCNHKVEELYREIGFTPSLMVDVRGIPVKDSSTEKFLKYYSPLKEGTTIDIYGVANEPGSAAAMHMTHMLHSLEKMETLKELEAYAFLEFVLDEEDVARQLDRNNELKKKDKVLCGNMQCTIWETAWYMRGMEVLMMDMMSEDVLWPVGRRAINDKEPQSSVIEKGHPAQVFLNVGPMADGSVHLVQAKILLDPGRKIEQEGFPGTGDAPRNKTGAGAE